MCCWRWCGLALVSTHASVRRRQFYRDGVSCQASFNSRLREEATASQNLRAQPVQVSTHASVRRRPPRSPSQPTIQAVSTHASVRRRPAAPVWRHDTTEVSTHASVRRRPAASVSLSTGGSFNSRLREEATSAARYSTCVSGFNSRLREEATPYLEDTMKSLAFQLTPP